MQHDEHEISWNRVWIVIFAKLDVINLKFHNFPLHKKTKQTLSFFAHCVMFFRNDIHTGNTEADYEYFHVNP